MANIYKITEVISKIIAILCFIGCVGLIIAGITFIVIDIPDQAVQDEHLINTCGMVISTYGLDPEKAELVMGIGYLFSAVIYALLGMIFRNINLIVVTARGGTWFSKGETPFQDDNIRMVREIGIFLIAMYIVGLVGTWAVALVSIDIETSTTLLLLALGVIMICLSKMFEYGKELQDAQDGLI